MDSNLEERAYGGTLVCSACKIVQGYSDRSRGWAVEVHHDDKDQVQFVLVCPRCTREQGTSKLKRWTVTEYYCSHCTTFIPYEGYQGHVVECLEKEIQRKRTMATALWQTRNQAATAAALADGESAE